MVVYKKVLVYLAFALNLGIIFYFWGINSAPLLLTGNIFDTWISLGRIAALLAVFFILLQIILIGRAVWVEQVFGLDKLSRVHHWSGYVAFVLLITHPILITLAIIKELKQFGIPHKNIHFEKFSL